MWPMTRNRVALGVAALGLAVSASAAVRSDFDGDGKADVLWRNEASGQHRVWLMNGSAIAADGSVGRESDRFWLVQGAADFTGDGKADILWRHALSGENRLWVMNMFAVTSRVSLPPLPDTDWRVAGVADFTGDGQADILWRHEATGQNILWPVAGGAVGTPLAVPLQSDLAYRVAGVGDMGADGKADILWRNSRTGENRIWFMNGVGVWISGEIPVADGGWEVAGLADFNGDGKADILWRHAALGLNALWRMSHQRVLGTAAVHGMSGPEWRVALAADVSGDRKADILWRHRTSGKTYIWLMNGATTADIVFLAGETADPGWSVGFLPEAATSSTLFVATLLAEGGASTTASGTASLVLSADERSVRLGVSFSGLTSSEIAAHVHGPADPGATAPPVFSLPLGTFTHVSWVLEPTGGLSVADQVAALRSGRMYVNVHTSRYPDGEIRGHFRTVLGPPSPTTLPNPAPAHPTTQAEARRFLEQSTMGGTQALADRVLALGYAGFIDEQLAQPRSTYLDFVSSVPASINDPGRVTALRSRFFINAMSGPDQLRQRVVFALSQILVVSARDIINGRGVAAYVDLLGAHAFGNFRQLLDDVTLNPAMGNYLDMVNNDKPNPVTGRTANENYARELLQLFSIGVFQLNPNGTLKLQADPSAKLNASARPIPTYEQKVVEGLARVFTGWTYDSVPPNPPPTNFNVTANYFEPMALIPTRHDTGSKEVLDGVVLPAGQAGGQDLAAALDQVFNHPNVGPFLGRQLIQHLVTSNPTPGYVARVTQAFEGLPPYGTGVRGDMKAVVKAVLLDVEARRDPAATPDFGRLQDPALLVTRTVRSLEGVGQGYGLQERAGQMGQGVFTAPTVFSFYSPDYQVPGTPLLGPPFQIFTESTAIRRANFMNTLIFGTIPRPAYAPPGSTTASLVLAPWIAVAGNPTQLVDDLSLRLMHGAMPADMRSRIIQAVSAIPATNPTYRAQTAMYLIATSAQYNVQR
jgi:uncharacterized protein (DUF1800 family)